MPSRRCRCRTGSAGLRHEAVDDAMERHDVVKTLAGQLLQALDVVGREIGAQRDDDHAGGGLEDQGVFADRCRRRD